MKASFYGQLEMARLLLEHDAGVNEQNKNGDTPLKLAADKGLSELVKLLLVKGADINTPDNFGRTALRRAASSGHLKVVNLLLETNKTDINKRDEGGVTALGNAVAFGYLKITELLLANGADGNQENLSGQAPLMIAAKRVKYYSTENPNSEKKQIYTEIIYLLLDFEVDLRVRPKKGKTLLQQIGSEVIKKYIHSRKFMQEKTFEILVKEVASELSLAFPRDLVKLITEFTYRNLSELTEMLRPI